MCCDCSRSSYKAGCSGDWWTEWVGLVGPLILMMTLREKWWCLAGGWVGGLYLQRDCGSWSCWPHQIRRCYSPHQSPTYPPLKQCQFVQFPVLTGSNWPILPPHIDRGEGINFTQTSTSHTPRLTLPCLTSNQTPLIKLLELWPLSSFYCVNKTQLP